MSGQRRDWFASNPGGHVSAWIGAYHDGELSGARQARVAAHLQVCARCRLELEELRRLSALLRETPAPLTQRAIRRGDSRRFAARVVGRMPPPAAQYRWDGFLAAGWRAMPMLLIAGWIAVQAALTLGGLAALAGTSAIISSGQLAAWGPGNALSGQMFLEQMGLFLSASPWLIPAMLVGLWAGAYLGLALLFALLTWGWIAAWWQGARTARPRGRPAG